MSVLRPALDDVEQLRRLPALGLFAAAGVTLANVVAEPCIGHHGALWVYLVALVVTGPALDRAGVAVQAVAGLVAWDFFFTRPRFGFTMSDREDVVLAVLYVVTAVAVARLAGLARGRAVEAGRERERLCALHDIIRETASRREPREATEAALRRLGEAYDADATFFVFERDRSRPARVFGAPAEARTVESVRALADEAPPLDRFVAVPERTGVQDVVLPVDGRVAVLHLACRGDAPDEPDRAAVLRSVTRLLAGLVAGDAPHSAANR